MNGCGKLLRIATWNVRTLYQAGKLDNCLLEMKRLNVDILGIAECRWAESGEINKHEYKMYFSGKDKHSNGVAIILKKRWAKAVQGFIPKSDRVMLLKLEGKPFDVVIIQVYAPTQDYSDRELEAFYGEINDCLKHVKSTDILITMGDWNAKVGELQTNGITGKFGLGIRNE